MPDFLHASLAAFAAMFPMINPIGHAPMFFAMTEQDSREFRRRIARKTALYVFAILAISVLVGGEVLMFFGISLDDLRIAGGLLVAHAAWGMIVNNSRVTPQEHAAAQDKEDISLTPMATPILAGPGAMSLAIGMRSYGHTPEHFLGYLVGFAAISLLTWASLHWSDAMTRVLNVNAVGALNRVLGFFILAIGVHLIVEGIRDVAMTSAT